MKIAIRTNRFRVVALAAMALTWCANAVAHEYVCRHGTMERMISVQHEVPGQEVPCAVKYDKPMEGGTSFPWSAEHTAGYCEEKADYLATRLGNLGWSCERIDSEGNVEETRPDTASQAETTTE